MSTSGLPRQSLTTLLSFCSAKRGFRKLPLRPPLTKSKWEKSLPLEPPGDIDLDHYEKEARYPPIVPPDDEMSIDRERHERKVFGDLVKKLPKVEDKLRAITPFERDWRTGERRWHRPWHHKLIPARQVWRVPSLPDMYNSLPIYQYLTKTCVYKANDKGNDMSSFDQLYHDIEVDNCDLEILEDMIKDRFAMEIDAFDQEKRFVTGVAAKNKRGAFRTASMLRHLFEAAIALLGPKHENLAMAQIDHDPHVETYWIRSGYRSLYTDDKVKLKDKDDYQHWRLVGDSVLRRGELAFSYHQEPNSVQIRSPFPIHQFSTMSEVSTGLEAEPGPKSIEAYNYHPFLLNLNHDGEYLQMSHGFKPDDEYSFISLQGRACNDLLETAQRWNWESHQLDDAWMAAGLMTCFASAVSQAHMLGFTQYSDLTYPIRTQAILSCGRTYHFFAYQLNTLSISSDWEEDEMPSNELWVSEPIPLFGSYDADVGFSDWNSGALAVALRQFLYAADVTSESSVNLRPYLSTDEECGIDDLDNLKVAPPGFTPRLIRPVAPDKPVFRSPFERMAEERARLQKFVTKDDIPEEGQISNLR